MKKYILLSGMILMAAALSGCSFSKSDDSEDSISGGNSEIANSATEEESPVPEDPQVVYADVLAEYKEVAENNFDGTMLENAQYVNEGVWNVSGQDKYSVYYRYADLAGDGVPELIISVNEKEAPQEIFDIYTIENGTAVRVINSSGSVGYRELYSICRDNRIKQFSYGGVNHEEITYYRLEKDSASLVTDEQFIYDTGSDVLYTYIDSNGNSSSISEEDYMARSMGDDEDFESEWELLYEGNFIHYIE